MKAKIFQLFSSFGYFILRLISDSASWLISRLKESSTWLAIIAVAGAFFGLDLTEDQRVAVTMLATATFASKS